MCRSGHFLSVIHVYSDGAVSNTSDPPSMFAGWYINDLTFAPAQLMVTTVVAMKLYLLPALF